MKNFLFRILCGFVLGISIFAPGVSGSVMAIIMGVYEKLLGIAAHPLKNIKKNVIYLIPMGIGVAISLVLFVLAFSFLFQEYALATTLFFIGLIAGNIPEVFRNANKGGFRKVYLIGIIVAFAAALFMGIAGGDLSTTQQVSDLATNYFYLGMCGFVMGVVAVIPGMSASVILMALGAYQTLLFAANSLDWPVIAVVGVGYVAGLILGSRLFKYIFQRFYGFASFMVFGFVCGSVAGIITALPAPGADFNWLGAILAMVGGLLISLLFVRLGRKFNTKEEIIT